MEKLELGEGMIEIETTLNKFGNVKLNILY